VDYSNGDDDAEIMEVDEEVSFGNSDNGKEDEDDDSDDEGAKNDIEAGGRCDVSTRSMSLHLKQGRNLRPWPNERLRR
jgi:hypothetical protein